jgi:hypothetical protein
MMDVFGLMPRDADGAAWALMPISGKASAAVARPAKFLRVNMRRMVAKAWFGDLRIEKCKIRCV